MAAARNQAPSGRTVETAKRLEAAAELTQKHTH